MTKIYLIRHGEASGNQELRYLGITDAPLTAHGRAQAMELGASFADIPIVAVYSSPLQRAADTATAIAEPHGLTVNTIQNLREMDFGTWEDHTRSAVRAQDPTALAQWELGDPDATPPGGESAAAVMARVVPVLRDLAHTHRHQAIAVITHVTPIKLAICAALNLPPRSVRGMWLDTAAISLLEWEIMDQPLTPSTATAHDAVNAPPPQGQPAPERRSLRLFNARHPDR